MPIAQMVNTKSYIFKDARMTDDKAVKRLSKYLSYILRHHPEQLGIQLDDQGWTSVTTLLEQMQASNPEMNRAFLEHIVDTNAKQRFAFNETKDKIRANQGHSVSVQLNYIPQPPPEILYHGTAQQYLERILQQGLLKGERHHVHLSIDTETARQVGQRHGKPSILSIDTKQMLQDGHLFYCAANGVWLTEQVPVQYLKLL
ncbi:RNA 2'-phosphotransferase [Edaphocola aurantiacus]|uniref:RNA 2'-phosphotransferase n=1 Tax=Edaphocola aurantiacus TaxID=2601682 RepID=UPI001FE4A20F|nr:RNA 2'-phosphotransferase [Edaphocola aurantiacus]